MAISSVKAVFQVAESEHVDLVTIGGDIFQSEKDADMLRPDLRRLFQGHAFRVIAIPGNHDGSVFTKGFDFGFEVCEEAPYREYKFGDVSLIALPYIDAPTDALLLQLKSAGLSAHKRILLAHCTIDLGFGGGSFGEEGSQRYFPVSREILSELGFDYVLAGHFHSHYEIAQLRSGGRFAYSGSPVSHSWKELGRRHVLLLDTDTGIINPFPLTCHYCDKKELIVSPGRETGVVDELARWYDGKKDDDCQLQVVVRGVIQENESKLKKSLERAAPKADLDFKCRDVTQILSHRLYRTFKEKLNSSQQIRYKDEVDQVVLEIMSALLAGGRLST